jgi:DNA-binding transcriptional MerR regulator
MQPALTIGDFSRITHLSVKTLRHYHRVGLLEPSEVDPNTNYRYYDPTQVPAAQAIRRFRELGVPVEEVKAVLAAPDVTTRNAVLAAHLDRLTEQLAQTRAAVSSLRSLLNRSPAEVRIERRRVLATPALAISATVTAPGLSSWWSQAQIELRGVARAAAVTPAGPLGGLYADELFTDEQGDAVLFLPVADPAAALARSVAAASAGSGTSATTGTRVHPFVVPAADLAVTLHHGSHADADLTYGALGSQVANSGVLAGPVREYYLTGLTDTVDAERWLTEICWPLAEPPAGNPPVSESPEFQSRKR